MPPPDSPTPEEEARLRRLLAESRAEQPMPDDVARRLDETLADLGSERAAGASPDVVPLDRRRRRRALPGLVAAAAVVVVAGVGVTEALTSGTALQESDNAGEAERPTSRDDAVSGLDEGIQDGAAESRALVPLQVRRVAGPVPRIAEERLARAAVRVRRSLPDGGPRRYQQAVLYAPEDFTCDPAGWGIGVFVGVRYSGSNAVLALREPSQQNQVAEVLQCGTGETLGSVTLAAP